MKIVIFAHENSGECARRLLNSLLACQKHECLKRIRTIRTLKSHLKRGGENNPGQVLLLLAESRERLRDLVGFRDLLEDRRLILVVPDDDPATLSTAHRLYPRFVTPLAERYDDLCSVIHRMAERC